MKVGGGRRDRGGMRGGKPCPIWVDARALTGGRIGEAMAHSVTGTRERACQDRTGAHRELLRI